MDLPCGTALLHDLSRVLPFQKAELPGSYEDIELVARSVMTKRRKEEGACRVQNGPAVVSGWNDESKKMTGETGVSDQESK